MQEAFLHFVWQFQYFSKKALQTTSGEDLMIIKPGLLNGHAGPDFQNAKVRITDLEWAGMVEIHVAATEWYTHNHHQDDAYENVILHVVWEADRKVMRRDGSEIPTLELKNRVDPALMANYKNLINNLEDVPCAPQFSKVSKLTVHGMLDRTRSGRLERKAAEVQKLVEENKGDWEEATYQLLARYFGFKVNNEPFARLARSVPYKTILKHRDQIVQVEALLFGQAGFLDAIGRGDYPDMLKREYKMLANKYGLSDFKLAASQWKFLRLRPANFPTVRLAQFCVLIASRAGTFSRLMEADVDGIKQIFSIKQSEYWLSHYHFGTRSKTKVAALGSASIDILCINSVAPLLVAYGKFKDDQSYLDRAVALLHSIPSESNKIVKRWKAIGYSSTDAFDSQALLELYEGFCGHRKCLSCKVGTSLLKPTR